MRTIALLLGLLCLNLYLVQMAVDARPVNKYDPSCVVITMMPSKCVTECACRGLLT